MEDDDDLRDMIGDTFIEAGFDVTAVSSAEAAMAALESTRFDILVTDNHMAGETGSWLIETASARGHLAHTAAIMLTSDRRSAGLTGKVLRKPVDFGILLATISDAVGQTLPAPCRASGPRGPPRSSWCFT
nr:response regulator [Deltaproteobacteria bacterium]